MDTAGFLACVGVRVMVCDGMVDVSGLVAMWLGGRTVVVRVV